MRHWLLLTAYLLGSGLNMGCNETFNSSTQSITHDSDPKLLHFQQVTADIPVDLGTILDLNLIALPTVVDGSPAVTGPVLSDLTGGSGAVTDPVTFRHLNAGATVIAVNADGAGTTTDKIGQFNSGATTWTITFTDATTDVIVMGYAAMVAAATAQAQTTLSGGTLDLAPSHPLTAFVGKTIDSVTWISTHWTSLGAAAIDYGASSFQLYKQSTNLDTSALLDTGTGTLGPGIGMVVSPGDALHLTYNIVSVGSGGGTITFAVNAATITALAIAQGVADLSSANIDFTSTIGAGVLNAAFGGSTFGVGVPTANLQHTSASIAFTGDNGTISLMACEVTLTDGSNVPQTLGSGGFDIDSGGSSTGSPFTANATPSLIIGFTINSTGTGTNSITMVLTPPVVAPITVSELTAGTAHWTVTYTDLSTDTFTITAAQIVAAAVAQGLSGYTMGAIDLVEGGLFVPAIGKTIDTVAYATTADFSVSGLSELFYGTSTLQLLIQSDGLGTLFLQSGDSGSAGPGIGHVIITDDRYYLAFALHPVTLSPATLVFPIDAATIKSYASGPQLAEQLNSLPVIWTGLFTAYPGWTVTSYTVSAPGAYGSSGPAILVPSVLNFVIGNAHTGFAYESQLSNLTTTPPSNFNMFAPVLLDPTSYFGLFYDLHPISTPAIPAHNGPIIMTEEYEIRNRNQAAFRFETVYPTLPDASPTYDVKAYASQGKFWNPTIGAYTEYWTPVPLCSSDEALPHVWGETLTITAISHIDGMPANYGGTIVSIPANAASPGGGVATFGGPWNKLKFVIYPSPSAFDFTGWTLQIVASAREL